MTSSNEGPIPPGLTLAQVQDSIRSCLSQGHVGLYSIGRLYNYTVTCRLAEKNGYETARQFFSQNFKELAQATLSRYGAVARQFTEDACRRHGVAKLALLTTYARLTALDLASCEPGEVLLEIPQKGGVVTTLRFADCNVEMMLRAVKHRRRLLRPAPAAPDVARVDFMRESFSRHFAHGARVQLQTSAQGGRTLLSIQGVPLDDVERLVEALLDGLQPKLVRSAG